MAPMNKIVPDPDFAALTAERFEKTHGAAGAEEKRALFEISSHSRFLARAAIRDPEVAAFAARGGGVKKADIETELARATDGARDTDDFFEMMRKFKYRMLARIIREDIGGADFTQTMTALSDLAEAIVEAAVGALSGETGVGGAGKFCVLGMGKLAGRQLNLSSDIDLVYVYETGGDSGAFFNLAERLTTEISRATENGFLYRVDLGLRPGGIKGEIAATADGAIDHYLNRGETWERVALMKARPVAGDKALGRRILKTLEPFIYEAGRDYGLIEDMAEMKRKLFGIRKERDVKLGAGGIREIEFFTQTLQILNGSNTGMRDPGTLPALKKLLKRKTIPRETADGLAASYLFLRKVEHNIQLEEETQTHSVPQDPEKLARLAARCGFETAADFEEELERTTGAAQAICDDLFGTRRSARREEIEPWEKDAIRITEFLTSGDVDKRQAVRSLESLGFKNPDDALEIISDLQSPQAAGADLRARGLVRNLLRALFKQSPRAGGGDFALSNLKRLMAHEEWKMSLYPLISAAPETLDTFIKIIGCDSPAGSFLIHNPYYISSSALKTGGELSSKSEIVKLLAKTVSRHGSEEEKLESLRHFKHIETLKLCVAEFQKKTDFESIGKYLSLLAAVLVETALAMAAGRVGAPASGTCVLGMGKLGGGELGYSSDLDIILLHEGPETEKYTRLAQRLIALLSVPDRHGRLYEIDTTLRPSGNAGTLVTSFDAFKKYNEAPGGARLWERQALIKAFPCAGGKRLGAKVMREIEGYVYEKPLEKNFHREIARIRERMEKELALEDGESFNFKTGAGAMVDVEFLVQAMQLKHGRGRPELRVRNTLEALDRLTGAKLIGKRGGKTLRDGYVFLGTIANLQGIFRHNHGNRIGPEDFERLAGEFEPAGDAKGLRRKYVSTTRAIRKIYEEFFN